MPYYYFQHPKTEEIKELFFNMNDEKFYTDEEGVDWDRIWTIPQAKIDKNFDPNNPKDFIEKTKDSKGSLGDLIDRSQELSEKRQKTNDQGRDKFQDKFFDNWSKKRHGKKHPNDTRSK